MGDTCAPVSVQADVDPSSDELPLLEAKLAKPRLRAGVIARAATFAPMQLLVREGDLEIVGRVEDDPELHGILDAVAALGLSLVSVTPVTPEGPAARSARR
jgi:hypothetical protein